MLYADFPYDIYPTCDYCSNRQCNAMQYMIRSTVRSFHRDRNIEQNRAEQGRTEQSKANANKLRIHESEYAVHLFIQ